MVIDKDLWDQFWKENTPETISYRIRSRYYFPKNECGQVVFQSKEGYWKVATDEDLKYWNEQTKNLIDRKVWYCEICCLIINTHENYLHDICWIKNKKPKKYYQFDFTCHKCKWHWKFEYNLEEWQNRNR